MGWLIDASGCQRTSMSPQKKRVISGKTCEASAQARNSCSLSAWGKREASVYLKMTREMYVLRAGGELGKQTMESVNHCVTMFSTLGEGLVQVDGDGFHRKGELLLSFTRF